MLVTLFYAYRPVKVLYIEGPARILAKQEEKLDPGLYVIEVESGKFRIRNTKQNGPARTLNANFKLISNRGVLRAGVKPDALRSYRGSLQLDTTPDGIVCKNLADMKDYVSSVVGSESRVEFPEEALKAQAVLVQTAMQRYRIGDDLNDSTEKQAYLGLSYERQAVREAVRKTWGQSLVCDGRPVPVYFHSCCAGGTTSSAYFSEKQSDFTCDKAVSCNYCKQSPFWKETRRALPRKQYIEKFSDGVPTLSEKDKFKRPLKLKYPSGKEESAYQYWLRVGQTFGWDKLPGTRFSVKELDASTIEFCSTGAGHGVGLCQWGACGLAKSGKKYLQILQYYFPGATLRSR